MKTVMAIHTRSEDRPTIRKPLTSRLFQRRSKQATSTVRQVPSGPVATAKTSALPHGTQASHSLDSRPNPKPALTSEPTQNQPADNFTTYHPSKLSITEQFWRDRQKWLEQCGYLLRPRHRPDWKPSWLNTKKKWFQCEDGFTRGTRVMDAVRISDGSIVGLKKVARVDGSAEIEIGQFFSSEALKSDKQNHSVPIYDILKVPDDDSMTILVMPFLRSYGDPSLQTVGESVELFRQLFEGLQFIHTNHVAHRDCHSFNIMMDPRPLYPVMYHPANDEMKYDFSGKVKHFTRTAQPVKYYFIDFGLSKKYDPNGPAPLETEFKSGDKTIPEFKRYGIPYDPFPTDVYCVGNIVNTDFLTKYRGLEFMQPLVADMIQEDPTKRPTMGIVVSKFDGILSHLPRSTLRKRLVRNGEGTIMKLLRSIRHEWRKAAYIIGRKHPLPTPPV